MNKYNLMLSFLIIFISCIKCSYFLGTSSTEPLPEITLGMPSYVVQGIQGKPDRVTTSATDDGMYTIYYYNTGHVYTFKDDVLVEITEPTSTSKSYTPVYRHRRNK